MISKVRNYGHDGLGEHGGISDIYIDQSIDESEEIIQLPITITQNLEINKKLQKYFKLSYKQKIKMLLYPYYK